MGFDQSNVAALAQATAPNGLLVGTFNPGTGCILLAEGLGGLNLAGGEIEPMIERPEARCRELVIEPPTADRMDPYRPYSATRS